MTLFLVTASALWVVAATITAMLPMRHQFIPGVTLLGLAPVIIVALGCVFSPWLALAATFGLVSMFRHPLRYFARRGMQKLKGESA